MPIPQAAEPEGSVVALVFYIILALGGSFFCSILEASLLSTSPAHIQQLVERGKPAGILMQKHKQDVERPISAILTLNTVANTMGAAGIGAQAAIIFGSQFLGVVSFAITLSILFFSEIIPKTFGAVYWRSLTPFTAYAVQILVVVLFPIVWILEKVTAFVRPAEAESTVTRADLEVLAKIGTEEGTIMERENRIMRNLLRLNEVKVETIMTPRTVVTALQEDMTVREVVQTYRSLVFSRFPIYEKDMDDIEAYVLRSDILHRSALDKHDITLKELCKKMHSIPETATVTDILNMMVKERNHMLLVIDEYGGTAGIVTLEDAIESLLGLEIVDESDLVEDLRKLAERRYKQHAERWKDIASPTRESRNRLDEPGDNEPT